MTRVGARSYDLTASVSAEAAGLHALLSTIERSPIVVPAFVDSPCADNALARLLEAEQLMGMEVAGIELADVDLEILRWIASHLKGKKRLALM
jgi:hypothetical protein